MIATYLDKALRAAGLPIEGVSIGDTANKATWRVVPSTLQASAQPLIDAFVMPDAATLLSDDAQRETGEKKLKAVALALWECIPAPTMTKAQLVARAIAIYKSL